MRHSAIQTLLFYPSGPSSLLSSNTCCQLSTLPLLARYKGEWQGVLGKWDRTGFKTFPLSYAISKRNGHPTVFGEDIANTRPLGQLKLHRALSRGTQPKLGGLLVSWDQPSLDPEC